MAFIMPRMYTEDELGQLARKSAFIFMRKRHMDEAMLATAYHECFEDSYAKAEYVLARTNNLFKLEECGRALLAEGYLPVLRYMDCPTVSNDDFRALSGTGTSAASKLSNPDLAKSALSYLFRNLNDDLFPWLNESREASHSELEAAKTAIASLMAEQQTKTAMRGSASKMQEGEVRKFLLNVCHYREVQGADFDLQSGAPQPGTFFNKETTVSGTKADIVLGLPDGRFMCLECKVSNTEVNSYKRLNHEVVEKVEKWTAQFGRQCVSGAVLQGCFKVSNLVSAQEDGAALFWSLDLHPLADFIDATRA